VSRPYDYVLDSSAVLSVVLDEPDQRRVVTVLDDARRGKSSVAIPFLAMMEVEYTLTRRLPTELVATSMRLVREWPVSVVESDPEWGQKAAVIKARGGVSLADAWMAALAILSGGILLHKDPEFDSVPNLRSIRL
jgi:predicted nucleic acid-binding protein